MLGDNLYFGGGAGPDLHPVLGNPMLTNPANGDFTLQAGSAAIDAGDPSLVAAQAGSLDLAAAPRFNGRIDIGAYELH